MIYLTRINKAPLVLNCDLIEHIEATPDTVITLTSGRNIMVLESPAEIIRRSVHYRKQVVASLEDVPVGIGSGHGC